MPDQPTLREFFYAFTEAQGDAFFLLDSGGCILAVNSAARQMLGSPPGELTGTDLAALTAEDPEALAHYLQNCRRTTSPVVGAITWRTAAGARSKTPCRGFRLHLSSAPRDGLIILQLSPPAQSASKFIALNRTLDELQASRYALLNKSQRLEKEIAERIKAEEEWERTFDSIEEVITIHDQEMTIIRANRAAGLLFGLEPHALLGRKCHEIFRGEQQPCPGCPELLTKSDLKPHCVEIRHDTIKKTFSVSSFPVLNEHGGLHSFVHIAKDITEQSLLQEQLRQAQKMEAIGTLAGGIAHDFNNILTPIIGYTELSLAKIGVSHPVAHDLAQILQASQRAKELVKQILTFSRQSSQERKPLQIHHLVKEVIKLLRASLPSSIEIRQNIAEDGGSILADPTQIHQILMNLCTNAYQAMRQNSSGLLGIRLSGVTFTEADARATVLHLAPGPYVLLEVSDTGCGMDPATRDKIFEPYFTTKPKGEGTGMGLAVVHGIVTSCGGHVSAYSEPGRGTAFHVYLPAIRGGRQSPRPPSEETLPRGNGERILVVDDEETIVKLEQRILEELGYQVTAFTSCEEALKVIRTTPDDIDLIVTDMTMPKINGLNLAREAKGLRPDLPVILCTGFSELLSEEDAGQYGICRYLMKPVLTRDFAVAVREALTGEKESGPPPGEPQAG
ncbi:MAG: response regulator [Deltaproteobacteria bacterium]|nr:response regulator [Deltaproteobacteria bacterium]